MGQYIYIHVFGRRLSKATCIAFKIHILSVHQSSIKLMVLLAKSSQVTFIHITLFTKQIISKQLYRD